MSPETPSSDVESRSHDRDKAYWEVAKLRAETDRLRRPLYRSPTLFVPMVSAVVAGIVAVVGAGFKYQLSEIQAKEASLKKMETQAAIVKLQAARADLIRDIDTIQAENNRVKEQLEAAAKQLAEARQAVESAAAITSSPEAKQALTEAQSSVATLQKTATDSAQANVAQTQRLDKLKARAKAVRQTME
jgi:hypothetical protein